MWKRIKQYLIDIGTLKWISDENYLKKIYKKRIGRDLNLDNPKTFNEKLQWLKIHDRKPEYTKMVDKYEAKKYVANIIGNEYIIPTIGVWDKFKSIDFSKLPNKFVLKCTHDSGGVLICKDKSKLNKLKTKIRFNIIMKRNFYYRHREWVYKDVKHRIIAEKLIESEEGELADYKFMCFNGKVKYIFTCTERRSKEGLKVTFYDTNWNKMPFERHYPSERKPMKKPENLELMIKIAEKLSKNIPFVRVDLYDINGKIYFGELTFYPGSGLEEFSPEKYDRILGDEINLSNV